MIKLIASDLDGTLLTTFKQLTERTKTALANAHKKGIIFVPATGRTLSAIPDYVKAIPSAEYIITSNGACVYKKDSDTPIFKESIEFDYVSQIYEKTLQDDLVLEIFADGKAYISSHQANNLSFYGITGRYADYIKNTRNYTDNLYSLIKKEKNNIENINIIFNDPIRREEYRQYLKKGFNATITSSSSNNIEISSINANKGHALETLCNHIGISSENVLAFGDSENDISMLDFAGEGVLMENSDFSIRKPNFTITTTCDNHGVARIIEQLTN